MNLHDVTTCDPPTMHLWIAPQVGDLCWCGGVAYDGGDWRQVWIDVEYRAQPQPEAGE